MSNDAMSMDELMRQQEQLADAAEEMRDAEEFGVSVRRRWQSMVLAAIDAGISPTTVAEWCGTTRASINRAVIRASGG